jgi:pimeloyl-ACP methyl ester carboxylesterase
LLETASWHGDTQVVRYGRKTSPSARALAFFHGFPGYPPRGQEAKYAGVPRLRYVAARAVVERLGWDVYLPGYDGLGESRGAFGFAAAVGRSVALAGELAARHDALALAGHSWGGLVAFNVHRALGTPGRKLALFAGLLDLESEAYVRAFFPPFFKEYPEIFGGERERYLEDLEGVRRRANPVTLAAPLPEGALLIAHGRPDADVSVEASRRFHARAGGRYLESDADHGFSGADMAKTVDALVDHLADRLPAK